MFNLPLRLRALVSTYVGSLAQGPRRAPAQRKLRLTLEVLEDRTLPSVTWLPSIAVHHGHEGTHGHDLVKPVIVTSSLPAATVGAAYSATVVATGNPAPRFLEVSGPSGLTINAATGVISWLPTAVGTQTVTIKAGNKAGIATASFTLSVGLDIMPPTATSLTLAAATTSSVTLSWAPSSDNVGVAGYRLYNFTPAAYRGHSGRGGGYTLVTPAKYTLLADHIASTQYTVTGLAPGAYHQYVVAAFDAAGNVSGYSAPFTGQTWLLPSLTWSTTGSNTNPSISIVANHQLYMTMFAHGNPAPTMTLASAPSGVVFTPGQFTNSQLTTIIPNITCTPTADQVGLNYITMEAVSAAGTVDTIIPVTVVADVPIPSLSINGGITYGIGNMTASAGNPFTYQLAVNPAFNNTGASPQYALAGTPFTFTIVGTSKTNPTSYALVSGPAGMKLDSNTGVGLWTPAKSDAGSTTVTVSGGNSAGSSSLTFSFPTYFTVAATNVAIGFDTSTPSIGNVRAVLTPVVTWTPPSDTIGIADYKVTVRDAHTGAVTTYDTHGLGTSLALTGVSTGQNWINVTAYDAKGNPSLASQTNAPLYLNALPSIGWTFSAPQGVAGVPLAVQFTNFNGSLPYAIVSGPVGVTIDPITGLLTWTPTLADVGTATIVVSAATGWGTEYLTLNFSVL